MRKRRGEKGIFIQKKEREKGKWLKDSEDTEERKIEKGNIKEAV